MQVISSRNGLSFDVSSLQVQIWTLKRRAPDAGTAPETAPAPESDLTDLFSLILTLASLPKFRTIKGCLENRWIDCANLSVSFPKTPRTAR